MTYADKNHRLSFLNIEPSLCLFKDYRIFNKSLPKHKSEKVKPKIDRQIFATLSKKMCKSRVLDQQNLHKLSMQDDIFHSPPASQPRIFTRNFSLASLRIHGTSIIAEPPEQKSFLHIQKKEKLGSNAKDPEKKISIKKNKKSSSIQSLSVKNRPKITTKTFFSETAYTNFLNSPQTARLSKQLKPENHPKNSSEPKSHKSLVSPLLNFKQITIKSTKNNYKNTHTDRIELKVYPEELDISGW